MGADTQDRDAEKSCRAAGNIETQNSVVLPKAQACWDQDCIWQCPVDPEQTRTCADNSAHECAGANPKCRHVQAMDPSAREGTCKAMALSHGCTWGCCNEKDRRCGGMSRESGHL